MAQLPIALRLSTVSTRRSARYSLLKHRTVSCKTSVSVSKSQTTMLARVDKGSRESRRNWLFALVAAGTGALSDATHAVESVGANDDLLVAGASFVLVFGALLLGLLGKSDDKTSSKVEVTPIREETPAIKERSVVGAVAESTPDSVDSQKPSEATSESVEKLKKQTDETVEETVEDSNKQTIDGLLESKSNTMDNLVEQETDAQVVAAKFLAKAIEQGKGSREDQELQAERWLDDWRIEKVYTEFYQTSGTVKITRDRKAGVKTFNFATYQKLKEEGKIVY